MNKKLLRNLAICSLGGWIALGSPVAGSRLEAQTETETKIRLMADALRARDAGDLQTARANLEQLQQLAPNDPAVQRLLDSISREQAPAAAPARSAAASEFDARAVSASEAIRIRESMDRARDLRAVARSQVERANFEGAAQTYQRALEQLPLNPMTASLRSDLESERNGVMLAQARELASAGEIDQAQAALAASMEAEPGDRRARRVAREIERADESPGVLPLSRVSPNFLVERADLQQMVQRGRSQYLGGDINGAEATFKEVEAIDAGNAEAKVFLARIAEQKRNAGYLNREKTREQLLQEVTDAWQRPGIYQEQGGLITGPERVSPLMEKLERIVIPSVNFTGVELSRVINTLSAISEEYDTTGVQPRGVNIVLIDPQRRNPPVNITLRNLSLRRVLDFIVDSVGYQYEVQGDAVVVRPALGEGQSQPLDTEFFPVSRATVVRMVGAAGGPGPTRGAESDDDPFAAPAGRSGPAPSGEAGAMRSFLQQAGVNFDQVPGSSLAYDGSAMIVTQTSRNMQRIRNILNRYTDIRQVEIEAKFIDVSEGAIDELGFNWMVNNKNRLLPDGNVRPPSFDTTNRSISSSIQRSATGGAILIDGREVANVAPPSLPGTVDLGSEVDPITNIVGSIGNFDVNLVVRALSRTTGADLLSAPKVTVLSGNPATINVGQELRYPESYGDIQSEVGRGGTGDASSAGVTITAGTPQEFTMRRVGVELRVTPTVEEDDYSISLDLNPRVTEFEGFVEFGGQSVAVTATQTVTIPSGFYQPIFSVREIQTKVTIWDGATLVMGGLTREEVRRVNDRVPVLGSVPVLGRFFRSEGEATQKRNLLIFVTANMISPGGSPKRQVLRTVEPGSLFQNPTIVTPSGSADRTRR
jgi:general secretion pathway protein D